MTIEFNCPKCGALIAFGSRHAGKRAKCLTCGQPLIIPAASFEKPKKLEVEPEFEAEPIPGFCRAVFLDSWKLFARPQNATTLVFVVAVVCFKFFLASDRCVKYPAAFVIWGWLFGFYLNVIYRTAIDDDMLPEIELGTSVTFVLYVLGPFFVFFYTLFLVELPFLIAFGLARGQGVTLQNFWSDFGTLHLFLQALLVLGLFLFPAAILTTAVGKDFTLLRPDYLLAPVFKAFFPYVITGLLLAAACFTEWHTSQYTGANPITTAKHLALNLTVQVVAIIAIRSIGLFYRHYACYFRW